MSEPKKKGFLSMFVDIPDKPEMARVPDPDPFARKYDLGALGTSVDLSPAEPTAPMAPARTPLDWTLDEVYAAGGAEQGRNSADTPLKLQEGLAAFSQDQRVAMVRALDGADDAWDEATALADAKKRVQILEQYKTFIDKDVASQIEAANVDYRSTKSSNDARVAEIDAQIAGLMARRDAELAATGKAQQAANDTAKAVQVRAEGVKARVDAALARYRELITFFTQ